MKRTKSTAGMSETTALFTFSSSAGAAPSRVPLRSHGCIGEWLGAVDSSSQAVPRRSPLEGLGLSAEESAVLHAIMSIGSQERLEFLG